MKIEKEKFVALSEKDQNLQLLRVSDIPKTKTKTKTRAKTKTKTSPTAEEYYLLYLGKLLF